jgi:cytochrome bd-type quinol oxidase subunit 2
MIGGPEAGPAVARGTVRENAAGTASGAVLPALAAVALGVVATVLGASMVARAERVQNRPSGFARWSAGWGVIGIGIAGGILLYVNILPHSMDKGVAKAAALLWPAKPAEAPARELTSSGYVVLAVFFVILVVGLGWCFYRAMKASAQSEQQQLAEGIDEA